MEAIANVLPNSPQILETTLAKDQPMYHALPTAHVKYSDGTISRISCYKLTLRERLKLLFNNRLWVEQATFGRMFQPQRITVNEPLTLADLEIKPE